MIMMDVMTHSKIKMMIMMEYWMLMTNVITPPYSPPRPTWVSNSTNDIDGDGCRDLDEDLNDDGDAYPDAEDTCPSVAGNSSSGTYRVARMMI